MNTIRTAAFFLGAAIAACTQHLVRADDAVGLMRVDDGTNGLAETVMPFVPMDESGPAGYLAGLLIGDGGEFSDQLFRRDDSTGEMTNALWSGTAWIDPSTGHPSTVSAFPGDSVFLLRPGDEPLSFFLFGRAAGVSSRSGSPRIRAMYVDPEGGFADLSVFTRGLATDVFSFDFETNLTEATPWAYLGRHPGSPLRISLRDDSLPLAGGRVYLAADATRDSDGDGLPDEMERRVYGTSPYLSDTDGDGLSDSHEIAWGFNPIAADHASAVSFFSEPFEPPNVVAGPIEGQNGWTAGPRPVSAVAQGEVVYEGIGALELSGGTATHSVTCSAQVVWVDQRVHSECGIAEADVPQDVTAFFYFDVAGHPVMSDGGLLFTNLAYSVIGWRRWTRCTMRFDYTSRTWDMYVDGVIVGEGLSMCGDATSFGSIEMSGEGVADNLLVTTERPLGLSSDGDELPDEWEIEHFGDLSCDGSADSDGDGMSDLVEFRAGTDPLAHNGDTDGDGLPDWWEAANGLNPLGTNGFARAAFRETFEESAVSPGDIAGQNGWASSRTNAGEVQSRVVHTGAAALAVKGGSAQDGDSVTLTHAAVSHADVVWMDVWQVASRSVDAGDVSPDAFSVIAFDNAGHPVLSDGDGYATNFSVRVEDEGRWVRCTSRFDFPDRRWDFYLDGILVSEGLAMRGTTGSLHAFDLAGGSGYVDDIYIGIARPEGLSSDGDDLPDEWEWRNLGSLGRDGAGDLDGDGLSDFDEYAAGTNPASADTDGDGLPDAWEIANGFDPVDASDAALDSDGDGLSNLAEFNAGTDPHLADADSDGLPDAWELAHGTDPFAPDALSDPDGDGLANLEEFRHGTNPFATDSDEDGICDYDEVTQLGTNPAASDSVSIGGQVSSSQSGRGVSFVVAEPQAYAVDALLVNVWCDYGKVKRPIATYNRIVFRVDGHFVASRDVPFSNGGVVHALFYTPVLPAGDHAVTFEWCHPDFRTKAELLAVTLNAVGGVDFGDVVSGRNHAPDSHVVSRVSPAFIEGDAVFPWLVSAEGLTVRQSGGRSWYVDVPLSAQGDTEVALLFEGLVSTNLTVVWESTDLFAGATGMTLRAESKMLFAGCPPDVMDGVVEVFTNGVSACSYACGSSAELAFNGAGEFAVQARWTSDDGSESETSESMLVSSVAGHFPEVSPACMAGQWREWNCPGISTKIVFSTDLYTSVSAERNGIVRLKVDDTRGERIVAARLFDGGPVLDEARIDAMWAVDSYRNVAYRIVSAEETDVCRCFMRQYGASDDVEFRLRPYTSSVTLPDFSLEKRIRATDFDECGVAFFDLVKTKSMSAACHTVEVYQNGVRIGAAVYGNGTLPPELR